MKLKLTIFFLFTTLLLSASDNLIRLNITPLSNKLYSIVVQIKVNSPILLADHNVVLLMESQDSIMSMHNNLDGAIYNRTSYKRTNKGDKSIVVTSTHLKYYYQPPYEYTKKDEWTDVLTFIVRVGDADRLIKLGGDETTLYLSNTTSTIMSHVGRYTLEAVRNLKVSPTVYNIYSVASENKVPLDVSIVFPNPTYSIIQVAHKHRIEELYDTLNDRVYKNSPNSRSFDTGNLPSGIYVARIVREKTGEIFYHTIVKI